MLDHKVAIVSMTDSTGLVRRVPVVARTRNEAPARAIEELIKSGEWSTGGNPVLQVTVNEPGATYQVSIDQIAKWSHQRDRIDTIGVTSLKSRVAKMMLIGRRGNNAI